MTRASPKRQQMEARGRTEGPRLPRQSRRLRRLCVRRGRRRKSRSGLRLEIRVLERGDRRARARRRRVRRQRPCRDHMGDAGDERLAAGRRPQQRQQLPLDKLVAAADRAGLEEILLAVAARDIAAGLADQQLAGGDVPGVEPALPEAVEPAGGDIGEVERDAAGAAHVDDAPSSPRRARP